jgi:hypothetical protein
LAKDWTKKTANRAKSTHLPERLKIAKSLQIRILARDWVEAQMTQKSSKKTFTIFPR